MNTDISAKYPEAPYYVGWGWRVTWTTGPEQRRYRVLLLLQLTAEVREWLARLRRSVAPSSLTTIAEDSPMLWFPEPLHTQGTVLDARARYRRRLCRAHEVLAVQLLNPGWLPLLPQRNAAFAYDFQPDCVRFLLDTSTGAQYVANVPWERIQ